MFFSRSGLLVCNQWWKEEWMWCPGDSLSGDFLVYLEVKEHAPATEQGFSFPAGQQDETRHLLLGEPFP